MRAVALFVYMPTIKDRDDAPHYRNAGPASTQICSTCKFADGRNCTQYDFTFDSGYVCDSWLPDIKALRERMQALRTHKRKIPNRGELESSSFLFPKQRSFPIVKPEDVTAAIRAWGRATAVRAEGVTFEDFKRKLSAMARRKGAAFAARLPESWRQKDYDYASTQFDMPVKIMAKALTFAAEIDEDDLAVGGVERESHVTVKYGLRNDAAGIINEITESFAPIRLTFGTVTLFERDDFDVVKVEVESEELRRLNSLISATVPHGDVNPIYNPHLTIAYVKPGLGKKYTGDGPLMGESVVVDKLLYTTSDNHKYHFSLRGSELQKEPLDSKSTFKVFKDANGIDRWVSTSATAFKDRDDEIVSTAALEQAVEINDAKKEHGPLRFWHMPGVDIGTCDFQMVHGRMLVESGTFKSAHVAQRIASKADELELSIGFKHPKTEPDKTGVFHNIVIFERSLTPAGKASNLFTNISVKGDDMTNERKLVKISSLVSLLGEDEAVKLLESAASTQKAAEDAGHTYKSADLDDMTPDEIIEYGQSLKEAEAEKAKADEPAEKETADDEAVNVLATAIKEANAELLASFKEYTEATNANINTIADTVKSLADDVAELQGAQPRASKSYRATQAADTEVEDGQAKEKKEESFFNQERHPELAALADSIKEFSVPPHPYYGAAPGGNQQS